MREMLTLGQPLPSSWCTQTQTTTHQTQAPTRPPTDLRGRGVDALVVLLLLHRLLRHLARGQALGQLLYMYMWVCMCGSEESCSKQLQQTVYPIATTIQGYLSTTGAIHPKSIIWMGGYRPRSLPQPYTLTVTAPLSSAGMRKEKVISSLCRCMYRCVCMYKVSQSVRLSAVSVGSSTVHTYIYIPKTLHTLTGASSPCFFPTGSEVGSIRKPWDFSVPVQLEWVGGLGGCLWMVDLTGRCMLYVKHLSHSRTQTDRHRTHTGDVEGELAHALLLVVVGHLPHDPTVLLPCWLVCLCTHSGFGRQGDRSFDRSNRFAQPHPIHPTSPRLTVAHVDDGEAVLVVQPGALRSIVWLWVGGVAASHI